MLRFRLYLLALLVFTGIALNIERLDLGPREDVVNLASFVYFLVGIAVISTILVPSRWKIPTKNIVIFWGVVYLIIKIMQNSDRPIIGGINTYLSIAELFILIVLIVLTRKVMENLYLIEETIANITLVDVSNRVKNIDAAVPDINKEFARSRRYKRPLGLVVVRLKPDSVMVNIDNISKDILRTMISRYSMSNLIRAIDKGIRRPDLILEQYKENRIILLLPEADIEAARTVSKNIQDIAKTSFDSSVTVGVAAFPNDAITFEDLIECAESEMFNPVINKTNDGDVEKYVQSQNEVIQK